MTLLTWLCQDGNFPQLIEKKEVEQMLKEMLCLMCMLKKNVKLLFLYTPEFHVLKDSKKGRCVVMVLFYVTQRVRSDMLLAYVEP